MNTAKRGWQVISQVPGTWWRIIGFVIALFLIPNILPPIVGAIMVDVGVVNAEWTRIAIPLAEAAAGIGLLLLISPWHGTHGVAFLLGAAECVFLGALVPIVAPFLESHVPTWANWLSGVIS